MEKSYKCNTIELRKIMLERGFLTVNSLSTTSGICRNTLGKVLKGNLQPSSDTMYRLVETLSIAPQRAGEIFFNMDLHNT